VQNKSIIVAVQVVERVIASTHDPVELFEVERVVIVAVGLLQHLPQFLVGELLANLCRDLLEVLVRYFVEIVLVEELEHLVDLFLGVSGTL